MKPLGFGAPVPWKGAVLVGALLIGVAAREAGVPVWVLALVIGVAGVAALLVWRSVARRRGGA